MVTEIDEEMVICILLQIIMIITAERLWGRP
jgi:hypothetical protein